ncbi:hypothetical protein HAX54_022838 [Datura stramonium]|uniref:Uncharacterized protein n=1 Tax=Datura stramonium TaxID=4076 RepID=A0ABS8UW85_DATST|nr:hypothetical protein [Datura stramonium]
MSEYTLVISSSVATSSSRGSSYSSPTLQKGSQFSLRGPYHLNGVSSILTSSCSSSIGLLALFDPWLEEATPFSLFTLVPFVEIVAYVSHARVCQLTLIVSPLCADCGLCITIGLAALVPAPRARPCVAWPGRCPMRTFNCFAPRVRCLSSFFVEKHDLSPPHLN